MSVIVGARSTVEETRAVVGDVQLAGPESFVGNRGQWTPRVQTAARQLILQSRAYPCAVMLVPLLHELAGLEDET
jgi:hypothetical protein